jgi:hypothetical protein
MTLSLALPILGSIVVGFWFPAYHLENASLHSLLVTLGGATALASAGILVAQQRRKPESEHFLWIACGFLVMGVLELFHAAIPPNEDGFIWLRTVGTYAGGLLFALVWVPFRLSGSRTTATLTGVSLFATVAMAACSFLMPEWIPTMINDGQFTYAARLLQLAGGVGFAAASLFFIRRFHRHARYDDWLLAVMTQLFAAAAILFELSVPWDAVWWWWHALRLLAYLAACALAVAAYLGTERQLQTLNQQQHDDS